MKSGVLTSFWRLSGPPRTPIRILSITTSGIFEPIPREELVTKLKSRLRDRQFLPGSSGGGFPEFLAEPRDSFPLGVRVNNRNQSSLAELSKKCMDYVEEIFRAALQYCSVVCQLKQQRTSRLSQRQAKWIVRILVELATVLSLTRKLGLLQQATTRMSTLLSRTTSTPIWLHFHPRWDSITAFHAIMILTN